MATARIADTSQPANVQAFLLLIQWAEGTLQRPSPYRTLYGGGTFSNFARHPNIRVTAGGWTSTAAGAYQILKRTADSLFMLDFTPQSQDKAAVELLKRRGAHQHILSGDIRTAIDKARKEWASFPGAGYNQPEKSMSDMLAKYKQFRAAVGPPGAPAASGDGGHGERKKVLIIGAAVIVILIVSIILVTQSKKKR